MDILKYYFPLCWFSANPLELPASRRFFKQNVIFYFVIEYFIDLNMVDDYVESFFGVTLETALTLLFVSLIVFLNRSSDTYLKIILAILFCENVMSILSIPAIVWVTAQPDILSYSVLGAIVLWDVALISYIIKYALKINIAASLAVSIMYFACTYGGAYGLMALLGIS